MQNPAILVDLGEGQEEIFEGIMDALVTPLLSLNDLKGKTKLSNSRKGSMYIVKPKMHGPDEVKMANDLFNASEDLLGLERNTLKIDRYHGRRAPHDGQSKERYSSSQRARHLH